MFSGNTQSVLTAVAVSAPGKGVNIETVESTVLFKELSDSMRGNLLLPGNAGYDSARKVLNRGIDKHPALIVQPSGAADVATAVTFARERDLLLAVTELHTRKDLDTYLSGLKALG